MDSLTESKHKDRSKQVFNDHFPSRSFNEPNNKKLTLIQTLLLR